MAFIPRTVLTAYYSNKSELSENSNHKYEFRYIIKGDEHWKGKLISQKARFTYFDNDKNLVWIKNYYYGKQSRILLSYNDVFFFDSEELDKLHTMGKHSPLLNRKLWELKAKQENDPNWLTRIGANFSNP